MKLAFTFLFLLFFSFQVSAQEGQVQEVKKATPAAAQQFEATENRSSNTANTYKNLSASHKEEIDQSTYDQAIRDKITYLQELACCEDKIAELQKQLNK